MIGDEVTKQDKKEKEKKDFYAFDFDIKKQPNQNDANSVDMPCDAKKSSDKESNTKENNN